MHLQIPVQAAARGLLHHYRSLVRPLETYGSESRPRSSLRPRRIRGSHRRRWEDVLHPGPDVKRHVNACLRAPRSCPRRVRLPSYAIHDNQYAWRTTRCTIEFDSQDRFYRAFLAPYDRGYAEFRRITLLCTRVNRRKRKGSGHDAPTLGNTPLA